MLVAQEREEGVPCGLPREMAAEKERTMQACGGWMYMAGTGGRKHTHAENGNGSFVGALSLEHVLLIINAAGRYIGVPEDCSIRSQRESLPKLLLLLRPALHTYIIHAISSLRYLAAEMYCCTAAERSTQTAVSLWSMVLETPLREVVRRWKQQFHVL